MAANFKIAAHLWSQVVVFALLRLKIQPNAGLADIDLFQVVDVIVQLLFKVRGDSLPMRISLLVNSARPIKLRMADA